MNRIAKKESLFKYIINDKLLNTNVDKLSRKNLVEKETVSSNKSKSAVSNTTISQPEICNGIIPALSTLNISFNEGTGLAYAYLIAFQSLEVWRNIYPSALYFVHGAENHPIIGSAVSLYSSIGISAENPDGIVRATVDVDTYYSIIPLLGRMPDKFEITPLT